MTSQGLALGLSKQRPLATAFNPLSIGSMGEWFDYRTLAGVGDGNPVSSWAGSNGLYSATSAGTARPTYVANDGDGRAAVSYDGVDDTSSFAAINGDMWGPDGSFEAWFVVKSPPSAAPVNTLYQSGFGAGTAFNIQAQPSQTRINAYVAGQSNFGNIGDIQDSAWHIVRFKKDGATKSLFIDGINIGFAYSDAGAGTWNAGDGTAFIGGSADYWQGGFRHFLSFKAPLDDDTAAALTSYLATA